MFVIAAISFITVVILWLALNAATKVLVVKLELLKSDDPCGQLKIGIRFGGVSAEHVFLTKKSLALMSGFLIGLYPVDVTEVQITSCKTRFSWGLRKFLSAWMNGGERCRVAPKLVTRLKGVRVVIRGNGEEAWNLQKPVIEASLANLNHWLANRLTDVLDKAEPPGSIIPATLKQFVDNIINGMEVYADDVHINWCSELYGIQPPPRKTPGGEDAADCAPADPPPAVGIGNEWNLGTTIGHFSLFPSGRPSDETQGATPRTLKLSKMDAYLDRDELPPFPSWNKGKQSFDETSFAETSQLPPEDLVEGKPGLAAEDKDPTPSQLLDAYEANHNSITSAETVTGTLLFPDVMTVLLGAGRRPNSKGKILAVRLEEMKGVVVQMEPFQVYGFLADVLPILALYGSYMDWYESVRLEWNKRALSRSECVPRSQAQLEEYANALGSPPAADAGGENSSGRREKRKPAKLRELDKDMSLAQIMLARMRVRKWEVGRPDRISQGSNYWLRQIDPFQGVPVEQLRVVREGSAAPEVPLPETGSMTVSEVAAGAEDEKAGSETGEIQELGEKLEKLDEEALSVCSLQDELPVKFLSLNTASEEEANRLEAVLYLGAKEATNFGADGPVLMEIDVQINARDVTTLIFHPHVRKLEGKRAHRTGRAQSKPRDSAATEIDPKNPGKGQVGASTAQRSTTLTEVDMAINQREVEERAALVASLVVENLHFEFNMLMGSISEEVDIKRFARLSSGNQTAANQDGIKRTYEEVPVELHTFSSVLLPDARPLRVFTSLRKTQGADLRVEDIGSLRVGDGIPCMYLELAVKGLRLTDYGALEDGGLFPTLVGGPCKAPLWRSATVVGSGSGGDGNAAAAESSGTERKGETRVTLALFTGGRLEIGGDFQAMSVVTLPERLLVVMDVMLACLTGPPAAREAVEMDFLEEEVAEEEEEETTGARGGVLVAPSARQEALNSVRGAYLHFGRMDARITLHGRDLVMLLLQDSRDATTNVLMAEVPRLHADMQTGSVFEALRLEVESFSVSPCVQRSEASQVAVRHCYDLNEMAVNVALKGPQPSDITLMQEGIPLQDFDWYPITERRIVLPVDMTLNYETNVFFKAGDAPEAETNFAGDVEKAGGRASASVTGSAVKVKREDASVGADDEPPRSEPEADQSLPLATRLGEIATPVGLYVETDVILHVPSGFRVKVTDLDLSVLKGIANSLIRSLSAMSSTVTSSPTDPTSAGITSATAASMAGGSVAFALDKTQRRTVAALRQAFRNADANGDGFLDREEVEELLRNYLEVQGLTPAEEEAEVAQFIGILDDDGTQTLDLDEFTNTMVKLMNNGPDEETLERGRTRAVLKAFHQADTDKSGGLCHNEVLHLLKGLDAHNTQSELEEGVQLMMEMADEDRDGTVDEQEFLRLMRFMRTGNPHAGGIAPKAQEFRSWEVIRSMLGDYDTLPELLAARLPDFAPPEFWSIFERETHASRFGSGGQATEAVQVKMVKAFKNYAFARDAWMFLVAPAWFEGLVRVGSLRSSGHQGSMAARPQQMPTPVRPGSFVYAQESRSLYQFAAAGSTIASMRINSLPVELAPSHGSNPSLGGGVKGFLTGVRMPAPFRKASLRGAWAARGISMTINSPCTLLVCFHDPGAATEIRSTASEEEFTSQSLLSVPPALEVPDWATELGLVKTSMRIETISSGGEEEGRTLHVYRIYAARIPAGPLQLGPGLPGEFPYIVLLLGGDLDKSQFLSRGDGLRSTLRRSDDTASAPRQTLGRSRFRTTDRISRISRRLKRTHTVRMRRSWTDTNTPSGGSGSIGLGLGKPADYRASDERSTLSILPAESDTGPLWLLDPKYKLGEAGRGLRSINTKAEKEAGNAAKTVMRVAELSSVAGDATEASGTSATMQPRLRYTVTMQVKDGVFLQMEDIHRLENTSDGDEGADPTLELAFMVVLPEAEGEHAGAIDAVPSDKDSAEWSKGRQVVVAGQASPRAPKTGLTLMLDFEHVASNKVLGDQDSLSLHATFGMEGRYFNPRVNRSEHFIEPWSVWIRMSDPRGSAALDGDINADRHLVLNMTTGLAALIGSIMEGRNFSTRRYSTTSVYTEMRHGTRDDDNGSRLLTIENHLGVPVRVTIEDGPTTVLGKTRRRQSDRSAECSDSEKSSGRPCGSVAISASPYVAPRWKNSRGMSIGGPAGGEISSVALDPLDRISTEELRIPDAKKTLPHTKVTVVVDGWEPVKGVPLDLLGRGMHLFKMNRVEGEAFGPRRVRSEGLVVRFVSRPARDATVMDMAMTLETNVMLRNDTPRPLRVALGSRSGEPSTLVRVDGEVCLPLPVLQSMELRLWRSPGSLVGGEALKSTLQAYARRAKDKKKRDTGIDVGEYVPVMLPPTAFDKRAKVVERHSNMMLANGVSVERTDLAPSPGLIKHQQGDRSPALWRVYVRAPYVVQNGLACDIVLWVAQPPKDEDHGEEGDSVGRSPTSRNGNPSPGRNRRLSLASPFRRRKNEGPGTASPSSRKASTLGRYTFSRSVSWETASPSRGTGTDGSEGYSESDEDFDTDIDDPEVDQPSMNDIGIFSDGQKPVLWVLRSGEEAKLEGLDLTRPLYVRVGFAPVEDYTLVTEWCRPYFIRGDVHTDRTALNKLPCREATFARKAKADLSHARRPQFMFSVAWEHTPGNRHLHIYSKVWVMNKTGISLAYRAPEPSRERTDDHDDVMIRQRSPGAYRTDEDTMLFSRYVTRGSKLNKAGHETGLPLMLNCHSKTLQAMPYAAAENAVDPAFYLCDTRTARSDDLLPCVTFEGRNRICGRIQDVTNDRVEDIPEEDHGGTIWPMYCDCPAARVSLPREVTPDAVRRVHLLTSITDATTDIAFHKELMQNISGASDQPFISFVPSRDCRVYVGLDNRLLKPDPGPPKWLALHGFSPFSSGEVKASVPNMAPEGFTLYSRFCRAKYIVSLGLNVDHEGDALEAKGGKPCAAMYFVIAVEASREESVREVDVGAVAMHRRVTRVFDFHVHHRWRLKPNFRSGDQLYYDRDDVKLTSLPESLRWKSIMHIMTAHGDRRVKGNNVASFQVLQNSRVLVCLDSRSAERPPLWLSRRGFQLEQGVLLRTASDDSSHSFCVFARNYAGGAEVKLGGNRSKGSRRMYFCLVHSIVSQPIRPYLPPLAPRTAGAQSSESHGAEAVTGLAPIADSGSPGNVMSDGNPASVGVERQEYEDYEDVEAEDGEGDGDGEGEGEGEEEEDSGGVVVESTRDQVFNFWDGDNGNLVQAPPDLDWQGRGWCEPFNTNAARTTGEAKTPAGVFGVTVGSLSGVFAMTHVVTVWPRFVVRNGLRRTVGVLPTLEKPQKDARDSKQSDSRAMKEKTGPLGPAARSIVQPLPSGASIVLYDFVDPDDYGQVEGQDDPSGDCTESSYGDNHLPTTQRLWKRENKGREQKLPCMRLVSGKPKASSYRPEAGVGVKSPLDGSMKDAEREHEWTQDPTIPVVLESLGKDTYVWLEGGEGQEDVLVRVSCRMLSNRATIHIELSDETPSPPLRIENHSATQVVAYRLGGDKESTVRTVLPMHWDALHWIRDDKRYIDAAIVQANPDSSFFKAGRHMLHRVKRRARRRPQEIPWKKHDGFFFRTRSRAQGDSSDESSDDDEDDIYGYEEEEAERSSRRLNADSRRYKTDRVGRLKDTRPVDGVRLEAKCFRPDNSVTTVVIAFQDSTQGAYGWSRMAEQRQQRQLQQQQHSLRAENEEGSDEDGWSDFDMSQDGGHEGPKTEVAETTLARVWTGAHLEMAIAGLVLNIIHSTPQGPSELAAFTVDGVEVGKPAGNTRFVFSVWHFQLDDMRADSPHPIILAPLESGFNSHLTRVHDNGLIAAPAMKVVVEQDVRGTLIHDMIVMREIMIHLGSVRCRVHVDFWIDVQDLVVASVVWLFNTSPQAARRQALADAQAVVRKVLQVPKPDSSMDRVYVEKYHQSEITVQIDFHLGTKVLAILSPTSRAEGDEEKDQSGFGASLALMPLGAAGGVMWSLFSAFGAGMANASPTFNFEEWNREHYNGTTTRAVELIGTSFVRQGVSQIYKVLGHINILGDPLSLGKSISSGVVGFMKKAGAGQLGEGSKDLVKGVVGGTASSASKIADALDHFVRGAGQLDTDSSMGKSMEKAPEHVGEGVAQGFKYFGNALRVGITGVVSKPMRGAKKGGAFGFVKGMGKGVVGLVAAPVSGALGATSMLAASIDATTRLLDDDPMGRRREPRHPLGGGERDDRERMRREAYKRSRRSSDAAELGDYKVDLAEEAGIDVQAEAGGTGLLLVPLTSEDMFQNYPPAYLQTCGKDAAHEAGAVAEANEVQAELEGTDDDLEGEEKDKDEKRRGFKGRWKSEGDEGTNNPSRRMTARWRRRGSDPKN